jgi:MoxR-like ATPase
MNTPLPASIEETAALLARGDYVAPRSLATVAYLALALQKPLLLEGEAGVGKTEIAKVLAKGLGRSLIRLQCYDGLDLAGAVYEWDYARQMIELRIAESAGETDKERLSGGIFSERFLLKRPLLQALEPGVNGLPPVLLIDELDRADEPFEAFLLELLSDFQISIPELGTVKAEAPPIVVITSNRTREVHDALRRRCLYHWVDYPDEAAELSILRRKVPEAADRLARQVVQFVQLLRREELFKIPGVAETLDWARALAALQSARLEPANVDATLGAVVKYQDDLEKLRGGVRDKILAALDHGA